MFIRHKTLSLKNDCKMLNNDCKCKYMLYITI